MEIWSDLALWDVDFGGSYFNTKLFFVSPPSPLIAFTNQSAKEEVTQRESNSSRASSTIFSSASVVLALILDL